jgi:hypothetical protein
MLNLENDSTIDEAKEITIDYINKIVNPFEFIYTNVPGSLISVSKVKPEANIFFELMEVFQLFGLHETLSSKQKMNIAHLTPNHSSTNYLLNMLREDNQDTNVCEDFCYEKLYHMFITNNFLHKFDLFICEFNNNDYLFTNRYINNVVLIFLIITKYQKNLGTCIIKVDAILYKAIASVLFIFSSLYDKVYLIKPSISNITKGDRYIVCKSFQLSMLDKIKLNSEIEEKIIKKININSIKNGDYVVESLIINEIPYHFVNKLEEFNAVIGQQQLEAYDQIINIFNNKNREEKIELLKRNHIQKCIQWCEKNQLPHNKFIDKTNIFLAPKKEEKRDDHDENNDNDLVIFEDDKKEVVV